MRERETEMLEQVSVWSPATVVRMRWRPPPIPLLLDTVDAEWALKGMGHWFWAAGLV